MKRIWKRFLEILIGCVFLSFIVKMFDVADVFPKTQASYAAILAAVSVLYISYVTKRLRRYYRKTREKKNYYIKSYIAYGIFMAISLAFYFIFGSQHYAWLFCITMPFFYIFYGIPLFAAILIFHAVMLLAILYAPHRIKLRDLLYLLDNYDEENE